MMLSSKVYYMITGADLTFALLCAVLHDPRFLVFVGLAFVTNWVGDKVKEIENQPKGDK